MAGKEELMVGGREQGAVGFRNISIDNKLRFPICSSRFDDLLQVLKLLLVTKCFTRLATSGRTDVTAEQHASVWPRKTEVSHLWFFCKVRVDLDQRQEFSDGVKFTVFLVTLYHRLYILKYSLCSISTRHRFFRCKNDLSSGELVFSTIFLWRILLWVTKMGQV